MWNCWIRILDTLTEDEKEEILWPYVYTIMENVAETNKNGGSGNAQKLLGDDEEEDRSWDSVENQPRKEMAVYEVYEIKFFIKFER